MVVFGDKRSFMSHIPMFRAPHDAQILLEVEIPGRPTSLSDRLYTFEPEKFSLDALVAGTTREMVGTLYQGSFENGGQPIAKAVHVTVLRTIATRMPLGSQPPPSPAIPTYWLVGDREDAYLVHVIGAAPSFDQVLRARLKGGDVVVEALAAKGRLVTIEGRVDDLAGRARPGGFLRAVGAGRTFDVEPLSELSCLVGPDFDKACE